MSEEPIYSIDWSKVNVKLITVSQFMGTKMDPEVKEFRGYLEVLSREAAEARRIMHENAFVFDFPMDKRTSELSEVERWQKLAFTLYTQVVDISSQAKGLLDTLIECEWT